MSKEVIVAGSLSVVFVILVAFAFLGHKSAEATHPADDTSAIPSPENDSNPTKVAGTGGTSDTPFTGNAGGTGNGGMPPIAPALPSSGAGVNTGPVAFGPGAGTTAGGTGTSFPTPMQPHPMQVNEAPHPDQPAPAPESNEQRIHVVAHGETLADISQQYYNSHKYWPRIAKANPGLDPNELKEGQKLVIPPLSAVKPSTTPTPGEGEQGPQAGPGETLYTVQKDDSLYLIAQKQLGKASRWTEIKTLNKLEGDELREGDQLRLPAREERAPETHADGAPEAAAGRVHVVEEGETLGDISKQYYGSTRHWRDIVKANPGLDPDRLLVGTKLSIPELGAQTPHAATQEEGAQPLNAGGSTYVVQSGDTSLRLIAKKTLGSTKAWKQLLDANPGIDPTHIRIGQKLAYPRRRGRRPPSAAGLGQLRATRRRRAHQRPAPPFPSAPSARRHRLHPARRRQRHRPLSAPTPAHPSRRAAPRIGDPIAQWRWPARPRPARRAGGGDRRDHARARPDRALDREWLALVRGRRSLINAIVHGDQADPDLMVEVALEADARSWRLRIHDQGDGFGPESIPSTEEPEARSSASMAGASASCARGLDLRLAYFDHGATAVLERARGS